MKDMIATSKNKMKAKKKNKQLYEEVKKLKNNQNTIAQLLDMEDLKVENKRLKK